MVDETTLSWRQLPHDNYLPQSPLRVRYIETTLPHKDVEQIPELKTTHPHQDVKQLSHGLNNYLMDIKTLMVETTNFTNYLSLNLYVIKTTSWVDN